MLTIPNSIQTLFKSDCVRKNFRVHFPNGERADITNDNVVSESVAFTESVMSENTFRYGAAERSTIEFETVGIENIYGMTIECGIEIDTSSLTAGEITSIQSDPGDGTLVLAANSDIGYGFYRIPYGVFVVSSCPRSKDAMTHRMVTAFTPQISSPIETAKLEGLLNTKDYSANFRRTMISSLGTIDPDYLITSLGLTKSSIFTWPDIVSDGNTETRNVSYSGWSDSDHTHTVKIDYTCVLGTAGYNIDLSQNDYFTHSNLVYVHRTGKWPNAAFYNKFASRLRSVGFTDGVNTTEGVIEEARSNLCTYVVFDERMASVYFESFSGFGFVPQNDFIFDPRTSGKAVDNVTILSLAYSVSYTIKVDGVTVYSDAIGSNQSCTGYKLTDPGSNSNTIFVQSSDRYRPDSDSDYTYRHLDAYDPTKLALAWLEMNGKFVIQKRDGSSKVIGLDSSSPISVSAGDIESAWWDEYDIQPIGHFLYSFIDLNTQSIELWKANTANTSVYDLSQNYISQIMNQPTKSKIKALVQNNLYPVASALCFTPIETSIRGLPWIEAGDAIELTAEDGTVVETFALMHTIHGIQHLIDDLVATGGEVQE